MTTTTMTRWSLGLVMVLAAVVLGGCAGMRWVRRTPTGGTIALEGDYDDAMKDARKAMARQCAGPFTIVEEGEYVVGATTTGSSTTHRVRGVGPVTVGSSETEQETEWRVTYACGVRTMQAAAPAPPPPAVAAEPAR